MGFMAVHAGKIKVAAVAIRKLQEGFLEGACCSALGCLRAMFIDRFRTISQQERYRIVGEALIIVVRLCASAFRAVAGTAEGDGVGLLSCRQGTLRMGVNEGSALRSCNGQSVREFLCQQLRVIRRERQEGGRGGFFLGQMRIMTDITFHHP